MLEVLGAAAIRVLGRRTVRQASLNGDYFLFIN